jgi:phosphoribosylformylglycinamidine synthase
MWQFAEAVRGLADGCAALGVPVTGGNVSFYNQTGTAAIHPTPVIGVLGVHDDVRRRLSLGFGTGAPAWCCWAGPRPRPGGTDPAGRGRAVPAPAGPHPGHAAERGRVRPGHLDPAAGGEQADGVDRTYQAGQQIVVPLKSGEAVYAADPSVTGTYAATPCWPCLKSRPDGYVLAGVRVVVLPGQTAALTIVVPS